MYFLILCRQILDDMWRQKMRSILALFGIVWGTLTVVLLLALGEGFKTESEKNIQQIGDNVFAIFPAQTKKPYLGFPQGRMIFIKASMIMDLPKHVHDIEMVSPMMLQQPITVSFQSHQAITTINGIAPYFDRIRKFDLIANSRFISAPDIQEHRRVAVLGHKLAKRLFGEGPMLLQTIILNHMPFTVVGVIHKVKKGGNEAYDNDTFIPYSTYISLRGNENVAFFFVRPTANADLKMMEGNLRSYFAQRLHFDQDDKAAIRVFNTAKMFQFFYWFFVGIQLFLIICGSLTLGVGSLGVANIMFLIVVERTREIGIRRAIGASDWHILSQMMIEALVITLLGGTIGFLISYLTVNLLSHVHLPGWLGVPQISNISILISTGILIFFGLVAGYFPARRAMKMDPVEALGF